jgi:colicin import membrane protein
MKNSSLTKTLLCGVMATTFFLINCQKAPNRGVKATGGAGVTTTSDTADAAEKAAIDREKFVVCPPEFVTKINDAKKLKSDLEAMNLKDVKTDSALNADVKQKVQAASDKLKEALSELTKASADATACYTTDEKTKKRTNFIVTNLKSSFGKLVTQIKDQGANVPDEIIQDAKQAKTDADNKAKQRALDKEEKGLYVDQLLNVSDKLAEALKTDNVAAIYFKSGDIITRASDASLKADRANINLSMCELTSLVADVEKGAKAKVTKMEVSSTKDKTSGRYQFGLYLATNSSVIKFDCLIADNMKGRPQEAVRGVFKDHLKSDTQIKSDQDQTQKSADAATTDAAKQAEATRNAQKAKEATQAEIAANQAELDKAKTADDAAKVKELSDKDAALKAKAAAAEKEKADADAAQKAKDDAAAKAKADADAAKKTQDAKDAAARTPSSDEQPGMMTRIGNAMSGAKDWVMGLFSSDK